MPEFTNAFSGLKEDRKLTHDELVRACLLYTSITFGGDLFDATNGMYASGFSSGAFFADLFI